MHARQMLLLFWVIASIAGFAHADGPQIKAEIRAWPKQPPAEESIAIQFRGVTFFVPAKHLAKQSTTSHELVFWYDQPVFQAVSLHWIENGSFMKQDDGEDSVDRYQYAKTPQEYIEKVFFLKDAQGKLAEPAFLEHIKGIAHEDHKKYIKYARQEFQVYRIVFSDEDTMVQGTAFVFEPQLKEGFIQVALMSTVPLGQPPNTDPRLFEKVLFSVSDKQKWFE